MNSGKFKSLNRLSSLLALAVSLVLLTTIACNQTKTQSTNANSDQVKSIESNQPPATTQTPPPPPPALQMQQSPSPPYTKSTPNKTKIVKSSSNQNLSGRKSERSNKNTLPEEVVVEEEKIIEIPVVEEIMETIIPEVMADDVSAHRFMTQESEIFTVVEEMPSFPGGEKALLNHIGTNMKYPAIAKESK